MQTGAREVVKRGRNVTPALPTGAHYQQANKPRDTARFTSRSQGSLHKVASRMIL